MLDSSDASDIGVPTVPLQQLHGDAATAALEAAGARIILGVPARAVEPTRVVLDGGAEDVDAAVVAVPHEAVAQLVQVGVVDAGALERLGVSPIVNLHVHYDRRVLDEPFAAAAAESPLQWLFDRTESSGAREGQLVSVSLSSAATEISEPIATLRERYLPAIERLLPKARVADVVDFTATREPRATFRAAPGSARLRPGTRTSVPGLYLAGAWTATGWPATMESAVRSGRAAAAALLEDLAQGRHTRRAAA
jgi:monoamine oxidase